MPDTDASIRIIAADNGHKATADYTPPDGVGMHLTVPGVIDTLAEMGINTGIKEDAIRHLCESTRPLKGVVIAEAIMPGVGENARIEQYVSISKRQKAAERSDGSVDYRDLGEITSVSQGQKLFRRIPPTRGVSGKDVRGNEIPGILGKDIRVVLGEKTKFEEDDPDLVVADSEGELIVRGGVLHISEIHEVKGDIDYSSGNVKFLGSVRIAGTVRSGFTCEAGGSIQINGNVEDATILAGVDVTVMGGYAGTGQGLIKAGRDVFLKFIENQRVEAGRDILLNGISYHASLSAGRSVIAKGNKSTIVGGGTIAKHSVESPRFGSVACVPTVIKIGIDPTLAERLKSLEEEIAQTKVAGEKLEQSVVFLYKQKIERNGQLPPEKAALLEKMEQVRKGIPEKIENLNAQREKLLGEQDKVDKAFATADIAVYPKVKVYIGNQWIANEDTLGPSIFRLFEGDVIRLSK